jgi:hypothetical protein
MEQSKTSHSPRSRSSTRNKDSEKQLTQTKEVANDGVTEKTPANFRRHEPYDRAPHPGRSRNGRQSLPATSQCAKEVSHRAISFAR